MSVGDRIPPDILARSGGIPEDILLSVSPGPMRAKVLLGWTIACQYHGKEAASKAARDWINIHVRKEIPEDMPEITVGPEEIRVDRLVVILGWRTSNSQARADIVAGAFSIDGRKITEPHETIFPTDGMVVRLGKKKIARIK